MTKVVLGMRIRNINLFLFKYFIHKKALHVQHAGLLESFFSLKITDDNKGKNPFKNIKLPSHLSHFLFLYQ